MEQFSCTMKKQILGMVLLGLLAASVFALAANVAPKRAFAATTTPSTSYINIDLNTYAPNNPTDFLYGITCDDPNYVYTLIYKQGKVAVIDKTNQTIIGAYDDPEGPTPAGRGFYSITKDPVTGALFVNEQNNGKVWRIDPTHIGNASGWTSIPIVEEITGNPKVDYPQTFAVRPNLIRIDQNPGASGVETYQVPMQSFGGVVHANNNIYVGLSYHVTFDPDAVTYANITGISFSGLAKIDPTSLAVTRISLPGSIGPTGLIVDSQNSTIMWVTDQWANKIYKYDLTTDSVIDTINLAANSDPRGIATDANNIYVALNALTPGGDSEILKIAKADTSQQTVIDTGAANTLEGTFTVFVAGDLLLWTDNSAHVGAVNLTTGGKTYSTTTFAEENHFGCQVDSSFWFAGRGSAVVGIAKLSDLEAATSTAHMNREEAQTYLTNAFESKIITTIPNKKVEVTNSDGTKHTTVEFLIPNTSMEGQRVHANDPSLVYGNIGLYDIVRWDPYGYWMVQNAAVNAGIPWDTLTDQQRVNLYLLVEFS